MALKPAEANRRKATLAGKLRELASASPEREELQIEYLADPLDQVKSSVDREITIQQLDNRTQDIHEIQAALERIEHGSYGYCEQCEDPIAARRLDAVPWARLCRACQSAAEMQGSGMESVFHKAA
jgi:DnaK suppressor protein